MVHRRITPVDAPPSRELLHEVRNLARPLRDRVDLDPILKRIGDARAIGVVYRPRYEQNGNYVPSILPRRYDAFVYVDHSSAVRPLFGPTAAELPEEAPETYPTGV